MGINSLTFKVSIIVPVYNCEKYLERCLKSLINQSLEAIEIILVNDGSTDKSGVICESFARLDSRIIVLHQENGGSHAARNTGLEIASGSYIGFVDADDFVDPYMFEKLYLAIIENDCSISFCDYYRYFNKNNFYKNNTMAEKGVNEGSEICKKFIGNAIDEFEKKFHLASVCRCLYSKDLIKNTRFYSIRNMEDRLYNIEIFLKADRVYYLNEPLYYYYYNPNSVTTSYDEKLFSDLVFSNQKIDSLLSEINLNPIEELYTSKLIHYKAVIINESKLENEKTIKESLDTILRFGNLVDFQNEMFNEVEKNMSISNRIIYRLLKYDYLYLVFTFYKLRRKYKRFKK